MKPLRYCVEGPGPEDLHPTERRWDPQRKRWRRVRNCEVTAIQKKKQEKTK